jgi:ribosomal protein L40E
MKCGQCLQESPAGAAFCTECGARLIERCRNCGAPNTSDAKFCLKCGQSQTRGFVERPIVLATRTPSPFAQPPHLCPSCGSTSVETTMSVRRFQRALMSLIGRKLYTCRDCARQFYDHASNHPAARRRKPLTPAASRQPAARPPANRSLRSR